MAIRIHRLTQHAFDSRLPYMYPGHLLVSKQPTTKLCKLTHLSCVSFQICSLHILLQSRSNLIYILFALYSHRSQFTSSPLRSVASIINDAARFRRHTRPQTAVSRAAASRKRSVRFRSPLHPSITITCEHCERPLVRRVALSAGSAFLT